jgi:hypothetical protein
MNRFNKLRRKIASFINGDQLALFMPKADCDRARVNDFASMDDATLAAYTRWFFEINDQVHFKRANAEEIGIRTYSNVHGILSFVRTATECNAGELVLTQSCEIAGEDAGIWQMTLRQLDEYDFGTPGVEKTWDGDKLVKLDVSRDFRKPDPLAISALNAGFPRNLGARLNDWRLGVTVRRIAETSDLDLLKTPGIGRKAVADIRLHIASMEAG